MIADFDFDPQGYNDEPPDEPQQSAWDAFGNEDLQAFSVRQGPKPFTPRRLAPEARARVYGYSHAQCQTVARWLSLLLEDAPRVEDCLDFWRSCQVIAYINQPSESQAELAARIGLSQQRVSQLLVEISQKCSAISEI
jgi:hypothetical protein